MKKNGIFFTPLKCFVVVESDENKNKQERNSKYVFELSIKIVVC